ncbi:glutamate dehydrogenase [Flavobacteriaceae bacterium SZ-1-7]|uniref:THC0290_0291 family protein n=1 Tax=Tamlana sedimenti TaxID=3134126 RepID=UPI003120AE86
MLNLKYLVCALWLFLSVHEASAQLGFSHELGVIAGPVQFRSDFGSRQDSKTNFGNSGYGIGIVHYINFSYRADCNCYTTDTYFNDHFKLRNEISYNKTKLEHLGQWVGPDNVTPDADRLRAHKGVAENFDIGTQIEFFPLSIRDFQGFAYSFAPFVSLGVHYTYSTPEASTTYGDGDVYNPENIYSFWYRDYTRLPPLPAGVPESERQYPIDVTPLSHFSMVASAGVRYKLTKLSDLMLDLRWQYYFNDWVDGLNHELSFNKNTDWLVWVNVGYIYYLD